MTQPSEKPRTAAGRALLQSFRELAEHQAAGKPYIKPPSRLIDSGREAILAIEAEAAAPAEPAGLTVLLIDDFDEMERQVEAHVRSCPDREDEVTQSCDLRTAWDALLQAVHEAEHWR